MMNSGQRTAVSLLVTVVLFAGFLMLCLPNPGLGLLDKLEEKFYSEKRIEECNENLKSVAAATNSYIYNELSSSFESLSRDDSVLSYFSDNPSPEDQLARENAKGRLAEKFAFDMRVIDADGRKLHHSTFPQDKIKQANGKTTYKVYRDVLKDEDELPLEKFATSEKVFTVNSAKDQFVFAYPAQDKGTIAFYVNPASVRESLEKSGAIPFGQTVVFYEGNDGMRGFVTGLPRSGAEIFKKPVLENWKGDNTKPEVILTYADKTWSILTLPKDGDFVISGVYESSYFELPAEVEYLLYICFCITFFLVIFLLASARHDDMVVIRSRVRKLQNAFIAEYLENKESVDWQKVLLQIEGRRGEFYEDVKRSLGRKGKKHAKELDACFEKSWDEIVSVIGKNERSALGSDINEFKKILEQAIAGGNLKIENVTSASSAVSPVVPVASVAAPVSVPVAEAPVEEVEALDEVEEIEEIEEAEELGDVEEIEEAEELNEVEEIEEAEELGEVEDIEEAEELDEVEEIEEAEELAEVEEIEEAEELDEVEEIEEAEELDEVEEIEEAEEIAEVDEVEEVPETQETPETEEVEAISEIEIPVEEESPEELDQAPVVEEVTEPEVASETEEIAESEILEKEEILESDEIPEPDEIPETEILMTETAPTVVDDINPLEITSSEENVESLDDLDTESELYEEVDAPEVQFGPAEDDELPETQSVEELVDEPTEEIVEAPAIEDKVEEPPEEIPEAEEVVEEIIDLETFEDENTSLEDESVDFNTFHKSDDVFATVDNIFAEELTLGENYKVKPVSSTPDSISLNFDMEGPGFGVEEELLPLENPEKHARHFSMVGFGANNNSVTDLESEEPDTIVEVDGVFSISEDLVLPKIQLDPEFKKLVDSVI